MRLRNAALKTRIDRGEIGDVVLLHQTCRWSIAEDWYRSGTPGWFVDPRQVPGGAFIDEGIYWIDFFRWLAGEIVQVEAKTANLVHKDIAVEDWGFAVFTFANGTSRRSRPPGRSTHRANPGRRRSRTASSDSRSSAREANSPISGSGCPAGRCSRRVRPTGCSNGNPRSISPPERRSPSIT